MKKVFISLGLVVLCAAAAVVHAYSAKELKQYKKQGHRSSAWNEFIEPGFQSFDAKNYPTAYVFLNKAYEKGCRDGIVLYRLAVIHEMKDRLKKAVEIMALAAPRLKKDYPNLAITKEVDARLGMLHFQQDQYGRALPHLQTALKRDPDDFTLLFITGQVLRDEGEHEKAYELYRRAAAQTLPSDITPDPKPALLRELMVTAYELKRYEESLGYAKRILAADPHNQVALSYRNRIMHIRTLQEQDKATDVIIEKYK